MGQSIPRAKEGSDYTLDIVKKRQAFIEEQTGVELNHTRQFSFDPATMSGNIENIFGVSQIPIGLAGPLLVNGEYAQGEFYIPMATVEGTLLASYNRGMKLLREAGGITTTVCGVSMQRAPAFLFDNARDARDFGLWLTDNFSEIKAVAESTTSVGKLTDIDHYLAHHVVWTRFNYTTGDAAGQNMVSKATFVACEWIRKQYPALKNYMISGSFEAEKRASYINGLKTRGHRVIAEATIPKDLMYETLRISPRQLNYGHGIGNVGNFIIGSSNNASHPANGLAAVFLATGQDAANIAESHQCTMYNHVTKEGDYYCSITLPSLIVATYGGGTGLSTQRECLEILGCHGQDKVKKFAEIVAAVVLAGELSLAGAAKINRQTRKSDWVESHEKLGRNR